MSVFVHRLRLYCTLCVMLHKQYFLNDKRNLKFSLAVQTETHSKKIRFLGSDL